MIFFMLFIFTALCPFYFLNFHLIYVLWMFKENEEYRVLYISFTSNVLCFLSYKHITLFYCFPLFSTLPIVSWLDLFDLFFSSDLKVLFLFCQWLCVFINSIFNSIDPVISFSVFWWSCFYFHFYFKEAACFVFRSLLTAYFCFYQCIVILHLWKFCLCFVLYVSWFSLH